MRSLLRRAGCAIGCALLVTLSGAVRAQTAPGSHTTTCTGTATLKFSPGLTLSPVMGVTTESVTASGTLSCTGVWSGAGSLNLVGTDAAPAACEASLAINGSGSIVLGGFTLTVPVWVATGTSEAQSWVFSDLTSLNPQGEATGAAVSTNPVGDASACMTSPNFLSTVSAIVNVTVVS